MNEKKSVNISFDEYKEKGLYLILKDGTYLRFTWDNIQKAAADFWSDPAKISAEVKEAVEFQRCHFCPLNKTGGLCDAIRPVLPLLKDADKYVSLDEVVAIYKGSEGEILHIANTTMQEALKYVSTLSLMYYCQKGKTYWKYFLGINPLMSGKLVTARFYLNMFWLHKGNKEEIDKVISQFIEEVRVACKNQVKRLNLVCKNDAFMNAFVNTQIATEFLTMDIDKMLTKSFEGFEKESIV